MIDGRFYGSFDAHRFDEVFSSAADFTSQYGASGLPNLLKDSTSLTTIFYLLYGKYAGAYVAYDNVHQFKVQLFSLIYQYGPNWEKNLDIQKKLRALTDEQISQGGKAIYNNAQNPAVAPSTDALEELPYINSQSTTNYKKNPVEGYAHLAALLQDDFTERFLARFATLFISIVAPAQPLLYGVPESFDKED